MIKWNYQIHDEEGLHARPIAGIVMELRDSSCQVTVEGRRGRADGKNLMELMALGARQGEVLEFSFDGADEEAVSQALQQLLAVLGL